MEMSDNTNFTQVEDTEAQETAKLNLLVEKIKDQLNIKTKVNADRGNLLEARQRAQGGLKPSELLPCKFNGNDVEKTGSHLKAFKAYAQIHGYELDCDKIAWFSQTLEGKADDWLDSETFTSFDDLQEKFKNYFSDTTSRQSAITKLRWIKWNGAERPADYMTRIKKLCTRIGLPEECTMDSFLEGLHKGPRTFVACTKCNTPAEQVESLQRYVDNASDDQPRSLHVYTESPIEEGQMPKTVISRCSHNDLESRMERLENRLMAAVEAIKQEVITKNIKSHVTAAMAPNNKNSQLDYVATYNQNYYNPANNNDMRSELFVRNIHSKMGK